MLNLLGSLLPIGEKLVDKLIPDPEAKQKALKELKQMEQSGELEGYRLTTQILQVQENVKCG